MDIPKILGCTGAFVLAGGCIHITGVAQYRASIIRSSEKAPVDNISQSTQQGSADPDSVFQWVRHGSEGSERDEEDHADGMNMSVLPNHGECSRRGYAHHKHCLERQPHMDCTFPRSCNDLAARLVQRQNTELLPESTSQLIDHGEVQIRTSFTECNALQQVSGPVTSGMQSIPPYYARPTMTVGRSMV